MADGIRSGKDVVRGAMEDLRWAIEHPMKQIKTIAWIEGKLVGDKLKDALQSKNPAVRDEGERTRAILIAEWQKLTGETWVYGESVSKNLAGGIKQRRRDARLEAAAMAGAVGDELKNVPAGKIGQDVTKAYAAGIAAREALSALTSSLNAVAQKVWDFLKLGSPAKEGPLSKAGGPEGWGLHGAKLYGKGWSSLAAATGLAQSLTVGLQPMTPLVVGAGSPSMSAGAGANGTATLARVGGDTYITPQIYGLPMRAQTPLEVVQQLRRAVRMGVVSPRRRDPGFSR
jgi:hypothetical protein